LLAPPIAALARALEQVNQSCDVARRLAVDPVGIVRQTQGAPQRELVGLLASALAFGNVTALTAAIRRVLDLLGSNLLDSLDQPRVVARRLRGFQYRMVRGDELGRLLVAARALQRTHGSLGASFARHIPPSGPRLRAGLIAWTRELKTAARLGTRGDCHRRGPAHVLADPAGNSACKRLMLYLRWMVRPDDGVDLGLWPDVPRSLLLIPVDTHVLRLGRNLAMTSCRTASWRAAEDITSVLRQIDPSDPVRFDFALCHLGMARGCPDRAELDRCCDCGIRSVCVHWASAATHRLYAP
jgi:uncharacterized protein (TIGR02757 family)